MTQNDSQKKNAHYFWLVLLLVSLVNQTANSLCLASNLQHPVLRTSPHEGLGTTVLNRLDFTKLTCCKASTSQSTWEEYYSRVERDAAYQFRNKVVGKNKQTIETLAGPPRFKIRHYLEWSKIDSSADDIWLYFLGGSEVPIRLFFSNSICKKAQECSHLENIEFQNWQSKRIGTLALGKPLSAIVKAEGNPNRILFAGSQAEYDVGLHRTVILFFSKKKCTKFAIFEKIK